MGAEISSDREYGTRRDEFYADKYRERYGDNVMSNVTSADLLEQYRIEKLKIDQQKRLEELQKSAENARSKSDDEYYNRKTQQDNYRIVKRSYDRSRRSDDYHRSRGESDRRYSRRSRKQRDEDYSRRRSRRRDSSRDRSRSRRSSSESGTERKSRSGSKSTTDDRKKKSSTRSKRSESPAVKEKSRGREQRSSPKSEKSTKRTKKDSSPEDETRKHTSSVTKKTERASKTAKSTQMNKKPKSRRKKKKNLDGYQSAPDLTAVDRQYGRGPWQRTHQYFDNYEQRPQSWVDELSRERSATLPGPVYERQIIYGLPATLPKVVDGLGYPLRERNPGFQPVPYQTYLMQKPTRHASLEMYNNTSQHQPQPFAITGNQNKTQSTILVQSPNVSRINPPPGAVPSVGSPTTPFVISPLQQNAQSTVKKSIYVAPQMIVPERGYEVQAHLPPSNNSTLQSRFMRTSSDSTSIPPTYITPPLYGRSDLSEKSVTPTPKPRTKSPNKETKVKREGRKSKKSTEPTYASVNKKKHSKITAMTARQDLEGLLAADYDMMRVKGGAEFSEEFPPIFPVTYKANQEIYVDDVVFRQQPKITELSDSSTDSSDMMTDEEHVITFGEQLSPNSPGYSSGYDLEIPEGYKFEAKQGSSTKNRKTQTATPKSAVLLEKVQKKRGVIQKKKPKSTNVEKENMEGLQSTRGTQTKQKTQQNTKPQTLILTSIEPISRVPQKSSSPERKEKPKPKKREIPKENIPSRTREKSVNTSKPRKDQKSRPKNNEPVELSQKSKKNIRKKSPEHDPVVILPTKSNVQYQERSPENKKSKKKVKHGIQVLPVEDAKLKKNKRMQHPPKDNSYLRVIFPSRNWVSKPEIKKTHDVGVGTEFAKQKSIAVQTTRPKEPATPIYFLKPISAHEVFIDDSVTSQSETDMSQARTSSIMSRDSTTVKSDGSTTVKSDGSWTKSSTYSSSADYNTTSEVDSVVQNFQRNSQNYASVHRQKTPTVTSEESTEFDYESHAGPSSMVLVESESIHASSFSARDGKVFCITRSRCSSSPPTTLPRENPKKSHSKGRHAKDIKPRMEERQIEPSIDSEIFAKTMSTEEGILGQQRKEHQALMDKQDKNDVDDVIYFNPTEVGKWVLDCYINDHKLTTQEQSWLNENLAKLGPEERRAVAEHARAHRRRQQDSPSPQEIRRSESVENFVHVPAPIPPDSGKVTPGSTSRNQGRYVHPERRAEDSGTEGSLDIPSDVGVFQKELIKAKHKIWKKMQRKEESQDAPKMAEQYREHLKQWNDSPTSNVVLAECCAVTDADSFLEPRSPPGQKSRMTPEHPDRDTHVTSKPDLQHGFDHPGYNSGSEKEGSYSSKTDSQASSASSFDALPESYTEHHTLPSNAPLVSPLQHPSKEPAKIYKAPGQNLQSIQPSQKPEVGRQDFNKERRMQNIDEFLDDLEQEKNNRMISNRTRPLIRRNNPSPLEDWRMVSPHPIKPSSIIHEPPKSSYNEVDVNDNHTKMNQMQSQKDNRMRRSMDSLIESNPSHEVRPKQDAVYGSQGHTRSSSLAMEAERDDESRSIPVSNPFKRMDQEDISSYVERFQGRESVKNIESEKEILKALEKREQRGRQESLEERTARILGIHRKIASSSEEEVSRKTENNKEAGRRNSGSLKADQKKDLNAYMNSLLTGAAEVSPATKQKFLASEKNTEAAEMRKNPTSPLAPAPTKEPGIISPSLSNGSIQENQDARETEEEKSDSESSDEEDSHGSGTVTVTESFSVNVSDSVLEADVICKVKQEAKGQGPQAPPTEYKIPENVQDGKQSKPSAVGRGSPKGNMASYTRNIYADTPGFHQKQQSFDTTEDEDTDLDASFNATTNKMVRIVQNYSKDRESSSQNKGPPSMVSFQGSAGFTEQRMTPQSRRVQDSPVPIANNSAPLTQKEIDIVKELCDKNSSRSQSFDSAEDTAPESICSNPQLLMPGRSQSRSPPTRPSSRDLAREKIAKSIGFNLQPPNPPIEDDCDPISDKKEINLMTLHDSEEYDIKILSMDQKRGSQDKDLGANQDAHKSNGDVRRRQVLQEVGKYPQVQSEEGNNEITANGEQENSENKGQSNSGNAKGVKNVMESLGLDPTDAWVLSV